ncbi:uncharacterized protein LOC8279516 isoform X2 [Ricinus communis]|uniref:uncharacterized protein LOC8279516 isoform X2 n=1 Tax=Ricinus communis TaxID=3988 RepID=UPI000772687B|nr:uncharacterized protein LOC8279516 isoform X2 [Ricinus communis]|eukprot:XP_015574655.1 uncharacterized protein LOC8279516 isoform X2 [Ricinus communis]
MKHMFTLFLLLSVFLFFNLNYARKLPAEDYWKSVMREQPMPKAIKDLFVQDPEAASLSSTGSNKKTHFVKNFDTRSIAVIYRRQDESKKARKEFKEDKMKEEKPFSEHSKTGMEVPT